METVTVPLGDRAYPVLVGSGALEALGPLAARRRPTGIVAVMDRRVEALHGARILSCLRAAAVAPCHPAPVDGGEAAKSPAAAGDLWRRFAALGLDRRGLVVAVGGGTVGDLAGFAASAWMRGVDWGLVPTTLLAMVDGAVGGKTAVNLPEGKNLVGAFWQPSWVVADTRLLATLPAAEWGCGWAEAVKHGAALDAGYLGRLEAYAASPAGDEAALDRLVAESCRLKAAAVGPDERDGTGLRERLNFGHSLGHAYERLSGYAWRHGEAVAAGLRAELALSVRLAGLPAGEAGRVDRLLARLGLPPRPGAWPKADVADALRRDKKNSGGRLRLVLLEALGRARGMEVPWSEVARGG